MKVNLSVLQLQEILDLSSRFVSKHSTLPVLENIYIKGNIDTLLFRATDMEKYIEVELPMNIDNEGAITVNAKTFTDIIKSIEDENVDLIIDETNDTMFIKSKSDDFKIKGIPANEYVAVPEINSFNTINIDANFFSKGISKVEYAVTEKNFSPVLTGVLIRLKKYQTENKLIFVGTDSFRLAEYKINLDLQTDQIDIIVPKININDIKKVADYFLSKDGINMQINFSENLVSFIFKLDNIKILATSLLIQGNFPEYENENIIPTKFNTKVIVDKTEIEKAIKKASIFTKDLNNFINISTDTDKLTITSGQTDKGEAKTNITSIIDGQSVNFGMNGKYILDFVRSVESSEMVLNIVNNEKPIVFKDKNDENYTYIVRPLLK